MAMLATKFNSGVSSSIGSPGGAVTSITEGFKCREEIRIGTWNVKTMNQGGKIHNAIQEMTRLNLNFLGVSEMRWPGSGSVNIQDHQVFYSGTDNGKHEYGVGLILTKEIAKCVDNFIPVSCRVMLVQIKAKPVDLNIIQVYAPTSDATEEEIEDFYSSLNQVLKKLKKQDILILMGDFNAKLGAGKTSQSVGPFGLGNRNPRGDELETFAVTNQLAVMNTWFRLHPRRLYTWKSPMDKPGKIVRNQIDYILISKRYRNAITSVKTYPGADIQSDHVPLVATFKVKLKRITTKNKKMYDLRKLKDPYSKQTAKQILNETLRNIEEKNTVKEKLEIVKRTCKEIKEKCLKKDVRKKKTWMTEDILELMEQRRQNKGNTNEYKRIQIIIRRRIREAKEREKTEQCDEIEYYQSRYDDFNVHRKVKEATGRYRKKTVGKIIDEEGQLVVSKEEKKKVWERYLEELFHDTRTKVEPVIEDYSGPEILTHEVEAAINQMKDGKAVGLDEVPTEILKLLDEEQTKILTTIFNNIYSTGKIPPEWLKSEFITLPKKPGVKSCGDYRTISLMSHMLKLFLKVIHRRIYRICEQQISPNQFGFVNAVGTREALFSAQVLFQKCRDVSCNVFACLIDYKKAFDRVRHEQMIEILKETGIDGKDLRIITNLYWNQTAVLRVDYEHTEQVEILRGVRQGCIISPILFNLYSEYIFKEALADLDEGISINGVHLNLRYADDTIVFADTLEGLQQLMNKVTETSKKYGLDINTNKTKFMIISKENITGANLYVEGKRIERVSQYTYLGTIINEQWDNSQEIRCRIGKAKSTFNEMSAVFKSHNLTLETKIRLIRCYVYSVLLYGVETWTLKEETTAKLQAFEFWLYRRILKISWKEKVTNIEVLRRMKMPPCLVNIVKCRKLQYLGHIMRNEGRYELLQCILQGKIAGKRAPGRRRISWLANLRTWFGKSTTQLFRIATNKIMIARMIANVRNGQAP
uniref:Craniofacial development protein 2 n=1 Tax=Cacopsylla melanoneura TaxID=428564 RepID=A0A8D8XEP5_9HEMI